MGKKETIILKNENILSYIKKRRYVTMAKITEMTSSELYEVLTPTQRDDIFRMVWHNHVFEDVKSCLKDDDYANYDENEKEAICETVANRYVYDGDYDNNLDYWANINNLINEEL